MTTLKYFNSEKLEEKLNLLIHMSWELLQKKVQNGLIKINKEASLQLQFAYILEELLIVTRYSEKEHVKVLLEDTVTIQNGKTQEVDVIVETEIDNKPYKITIEMKCYRTKTSSGKNRGAMNIFAKDVYEDIEVLENYKKTNPDIKKTYFLAMTDYKNFVEPDPEKKTAKYWDYDISDGHIIKGPHTFTTPVGGKEVNIKIDGTYTFNWTSVKNTETQYYFLCLE